MGVDFVMDLSKDLLVMVMFECKVESDEDFF